MTAMKSPFARLVGAIAVVIIMSGVVPDGVGASISVCSEAEIQQCIQNLPGLGRDTAPDISMEDYDHMCNVWYDRVEACLRNVDEACALLADNSTLWGNSNQEREIGAGHISDITTQEDEQLESQNNTSTTAEISSTTFTTVETSTSTRTETSTVTNDNSALTEVRVKALRQSMDEMKAGYVFLCDGDHKQQYRDAVKPCLKSNTIDLSTATARCQHQYSNDTWWLNTELTQNFYTFCTAATSYLSCVRTGVTDTCADDTAAQWVWAYHAALWKPHTDDIGCDTDGGLEAGAVAMISICCGASFLCLVFVGVSFAVKTKGLAELEQEEADRLRRPSVATLSPNRDDESDGANATTATSPLSRNANGKKPDGGIAKVTDNSPTPSTSSVADGATNTPVPPTPKHGILKRRRNKSDSSKK